MEAWQKVTANAEKSIDERMAQKIYSPSPEVDDQTHFL
jgi:hypothetical protein